MRIRMLGLLAAASVIGLAATGCESGGVDASEIASLRSENRELKGLVAQLGEKVDALAKAPAAAESAGARPEMPDIKAALKQHRDDVLNEVDGRLARLQTAAAPTVTEATTAASGAPIVPEEARAVFDAYMKENFDKYAEDKAARDEVIRQTAERERRRTQTIANIDRQLDRIAEGTPMSAADREKVKTIYVELAEKSRELWDNARQGGQEPDWRAIGEQATQLRAAAETTLKSSVTPEVYSAVTESGLGRMGGGMGGFQRGEMPGGREGQPRANTPRRSGDANPAEPNGEGGGDNPQPRRRNRDNNN